MTPRQRDAINRRLWTACIALAYVGLSFVLITHSQVWTGFYNDSDDYMRLAGVFDLLDGQGWYDLAQKRLSPGDHFVLPWSRLIDAPLAGLIMLFEPMVGRMGAAMVASFLVPLLYLAAFCFVLPLLARGMLARRQAWLLVLAALCSFALLRSLRPMRVDHHGIQILLALIGFAGMQLYLLRPAWRWRVLTGLAAACGLAVGAEAFLWVMLAAGYIFAQAAWLGGTLVRDAERFALALLGGLMALMPVVTPPALWLGHELALPALPHVLGAAGMFALARGMRLARGRWERFAALGGGGLALLGLFLWLMPGLRDGVYGTQMSEDNRQLVLGRVVEAQSFYARFMGMNFRTLTLFSLWPMLGHNLLLPLAGLCVVLAQMMRRRRGRAGRLWRLHGWFLLPVVMLGLCWQSRVVTYMQLYALLPVAWLAAQGWLMIGRRIERRPLRQAAQVAFVLLALPGLTVWPSNRAQGAQAAELLLFPAWHVERPCNFRDVAEMLADPKLFGKRPVNIMTSMTGGAELLFRTPHRVFAAPYDVTGNALSQEFFSTRAMARVKDIARTHDVALIVMCQAYAPFFLPDAAARRAVREAAEYRSYGQPVPPEVNARRAFIDYIVSGDVPDWLHAIRMPYLNMYVYRVDLPEGGEKAIIKP